MSKLAAFKYRTDDAFRAITRRAVKEARLQEIKRELLCAARRCRDAMRRRAALARMLAARSDPCEIWRTR
eukprot:3245467-Prymnesium_polylepis.1